MNIKQLWQNLNRREQIDVSVILLYFSLMAVGQLTRQDFQGLIWYASDLIVILWMARHITEVSKFVTEIIAWMRRHPLALVVAGWVLLSVSIGTVNSGQIRPLLIILRLVVYTLFAGSVGVVFVKKRSMLRLFLVMTGLLIAWLGMLQYLFLPDTRFLMTLGWDEHYYRLVGTLLDPNFTGMLLVLTSLAVVSLASRLPAFLSLSALLFLAACIAVTYSRSTYLAYLFAIILTISIPNAIPFKRLLDKILLSLLLGAVFISALAIAPKPGGEGVKLLRTASANARVESSITYINTFTVWSSLIGRGLFVTPNQEELTIANQSSPSATTEVSVFFENETQSTPPNHAHAPDNLLITLLSGVGVFGTVAILALFLIGIHDLAKREVMTAIALGSVLIHAQFNNTLFEPFIFQYLLLFILAPLPLLHKEHHNFRSAKLTKVQREK